MTFPGFSDLYTLDDPVASRPYRADFREDDHGLPLSRGEVTTEVPVGLTWAMGGGAPGDVVWSTSVHPLVVHARVAEVLRAHAFTGWGTYPVTVVARSGVEHHDYVGLAVTGRCGPVDLARSVVGLQEFPGGWAPYFEGQYFVPDTWDGSDLFMEAPDHLGRSTSHRYVSGRVRSALERAGVRNLDFTALPDRRVATSVYTIGSPHLLPADYAARVDAAYAAAGVPRPDWVR